jgi:hypothetical protein
MNLAMAQIWFTLYLAVLLAAFSRLRKTLREITAPRSS